MQKFYRYPGRIQAMKNELDHDCSMHQCPIFSKESHDRKRALLLHLEELLEALTDEVRA